MIRIVICNESMEYAQTLFNIMMEILKKAKFPCELSFCNGLDKAVKNLKQNINYYDIIVLDAADNKHLSLANKLRQKNMAASIIFSVNPDYNIINLFRFRPTAVISNPKDAKQVLDALRLTCNEQKFAKPYFTVKNKDMLMRINFSDIRYFESKKRIVALYTKKQVIEFYSKLSEVMALLPTTSFVRCHQSYIINLAEITSLDKTNRCFRLNSGTTIEISKSYYPDVIKQFNMFTEFR